MFKKRTAKECQWVLKECNSKDRNFGQTYTTNRDKTNKITYLNCINQAKKYFIEIAIYIF